MKIHPLTLNPKKSKHNDLFDAFALILFSHRKHPTTGKVIFSFGAFSSVILVENSKNDGYYSAEKQPTSRAVIFAASIHSTLANRICYRIFYCSYLDF